MRAYCPEGCGTLLTVTRKARKQRKTLRNSIRRHLMGGAHLMYEKRRISELLDQAMEATW